jgi:hypothetical protein
VEEAIVGIALAMGGMIEEVGDEELGNRFLVRAVGTRVSIGAMIQRDISRDDAILLAAHLAIAAGDFGPATMRRITGLLRMQKRAKRDEK